MRTALIILAIIIVIGVAAVLFWALTLNSDQGKQVEVRNAFEQAIEQGAEDNGNLASRVTPKESSIVGDYALQIWSDENVGGVALFKNEPGKGWTMIAIDGGAWDVAALVAEGVPQNIATELVKVQN